MKYRCALKEPYDNQISVAGISQSVSSLSQVLVDPTTSRLDLARPVSYSTGTWGSFLGVKRLKHEAEHSYPFPRSRMVELQLHSLISLDDLVIE